MLLFTEVLDESAIMNNECVFLKRYRNNCNTHLNRMHLSSWHVNLAVHMTTEFWPVYLHCVCAGA